MLQNSELLTGAVYLAGYGVECILKALIIDVVPKSRRAAILSSFRGNSAHSYHWLRSLYLQNGGARLPKEVTRGFTLTESWSTELRYSPKELKRKDADEFLRAASHILEWARARF